MARLLPSLLLALSLALDARIVLGSPPCRVVEGLPWTMEKVPEASFSGVLVGQTGSGKSTLLDLAAGHDYAKTGSLGGESQTSETCTYWFDWLGGKDSSAPSEMWQLTDTPGFHDTKGPQQDLANQEAIAEELRRLGQADAIVVVFSAMEKLTAESMSTFGFVRSYFGASAFRKLIVYYSFFSWTGICFGSKCQCTPREDLRKVHQSVMDKAFDYITGDLGTGDVRCNSSNSTACFPQASDIPYVGSDLYMEKLELGKGAGCDLLNPDDSCYMGCKPNAAEELRRFRTAALNLTRSPGYEPVNLSAISNTWVDCQKALAEIRAFKSSKAPYNMTNGTAYTRLCFRGDIRSKVDELRNELLGSDDAQGSMAWNLEPFYLQPLYGFDIVTADAVAKYPDFATFQTCRLALTAPPSAAVSDAQEACWKGLSQAHIEQAPKLQEAKDDLHAIVRCRCTGASYNCSLTKENGACGAGTYCSLDGDWGLQSDAAICKGNCATATCSWPDYVVKRAVEQPRFCAGKTCSEEECCTTSEAVCEAGSGSDTTGSCRVFNCWKWRGPTECVEHECMCQHGFCERSGKCYSADNIRLCEAVEVPCGAMHSVRTTDNMGFGKNLCVCDDGYCSVNEECRAIPELEAECKSQPEQPQCSRIREVLGLGSPDVRAQAAPPSTPSSALDAVKLPFVLLAAAAVLSFVGMRLYDQRRPRGEALLPNAF